MRRGLISDENWVAELPEPVRSAIAERSVQRVYSAGQDVCRSGDIPPGVVQIVSGYVRLHAPQEDGRQMLIAIYSPGNCFAETAVVNKRPLRHTTSALCDATVRVLPIAEFWELYSRHPEIPQALCSKFAHALSSHIASREIRASKRLGQCIAMVLQHASDVCGKQYVDGRELTCPITQQDLADHLNVTRQSVQREVKELKRAGLIRRNGRRWMIRDSITLQQFWAT